MTKLQKAANLFAVTVALAVLAFCLLVFPKQARAQTLTQPEHQITHTPQNGVTCTISTFKVGTTFYIQTVCARAGGALSVSVIRG